MVNRSATATEFGFDFQRNAAIVLMLENIKDMVSLRSEGNYEDIQIKLSDGSYVLAQAKSVVNSSTDFTNVKANLKAALRSLSDGSSQCDVSELILITNSPNPLDQKASENLFLGMAHRKYNTLPDKSKKLIDKYLKSIVNPLDTNKFMIQILPFETDDLSERYKIVKQNVDEFVFDKKINIPGISKCLLKTWQEDIFVNGTKKDTEIVLTKNDVIWPMIVIITDIERIDEDFEEFLDCGEYEELVASYKDLINSNCEKFEYITRIISDYNSYSSDYRGKEKIKSFVKDRWNLYVDMFGIKNLDSYLQERLTEIIIYIILKNRFSIDKIKQGVNL